MLFPECWVEDPAGTTRRTGAAEGADFYAFELVRDNEERTDTSPEFRDINKNGNDKLLGEDAPRGMFVATDLGQESLIYDDDRLGEVKLSLQFASDVHAGSWHFLVKACVDRREEELGSIDCDPGYNKVELEFVLCADIDDSDEFPVCKDDVVPDLDEEEDEEEEDEGEDDTEDKE